MILGGNFDLLSILLTTAAFILAIAFHEGNHALVATALGDDTPRRYGRLSLNPMRHIDPMGILFFVLAGVGWGWTPVSAANLRPNPRLGSAMVAVAGPAANLILAVVFTLILHAGLQLPTLLATFLVIAARLNLILLVFNLLPIPPLDGFSFLVGVLPRGPSEYLRQLERVGPGLLMALFFASSIFHFNPVGLLINPLTRAFGLR